MYPFRKFKCHNYYKDIQSIYELLIRCPWLFHYFHFWIRSTTLDKLIIAASVLRHTSGDKGAMQFGLLTFYSQMPKLLSYNFCVPKSIQEVEDYFST